MAEHTPRTQAERRAATITALLDATIDSLVDVGFVATTTRSVAERAGVSQGAQQHYFPTKAELVDAAIVRLMEQMVIDAAERPAPDGSERDRAASMLDQLWELHNLPITPAVFELFNVARTEPQLARRVAQLTAQGMAAIRALAGVAVPTYASQPGFDDLLQISIATIRGTVILAAVPGTDAAHPTWPVVREHLLNSFDAMLPASDH